MRRYDDAGHETAWQRRLSRRRFAAVAATAAAAPLVASPSYAAQPGTPVASPAPVGATPAAIGPQLTVSPTTVRLDEPFSVIVTGLAPGQQVTVSSRFTDYAKNDWSASATWGVSGTPLDLAAQPPNDGDFRVPDPMALIWAANGAPYYEPPLYSTETVTITATVDGERIGQATVQRGLGLGEDQLNYVYNDQMVADFITPVAGAPRPAPAVIVLGGSEGWPSPGADVAAAFLAAHGYAALALGYFGPVGHLPRTLENVPLEYFGTAIDWLKQQPSVRKDRIGVIGYSRGGELALLLGAHYPELIAVVSMSGSGYAVASPTAPSQPAWTWRGKPIPYLVSLQETAAEFARAEIPVERTNGPILMVSGEGDKLWPSTQLTSAAWNQLQRTHHPFPDQFLRYSGAGHLIEPPYMPMTPLVAPEYGGDPLSNEIASVNSWRAILHLFDERLRY